MYNLVNLIFFFSSRRRHTRYWRDWSSDVCSSDLALRDGAVRGRVRHLCAPHRTWPLASRARGVVACLLGLDTGRSADPVLVLALPGWTAAVPSLARRGVAYGRRDLAGHDLRRAGARFPSRV